MEDSNASVDTLREEKVAANSAGMSSSMSPGLDTTISGAVPDTALFEDPEASSPLVVSPSRVGGKPSAVGSASGTTPKVVDGGESRLEGRVIVGNDVAEEDLRPVTGAMG